MQIDSLNEKIAELDNETFPGKPDEQAVDFFHAHLGEVTDHAVATDWYNKYRAALRDAPNGIDKVRSAVSPTRRRQTQRSRISNASFSGSTSIAWAMRSGVVEAANKVLVNQRMKRAIMD